MNSIEIIADQILQLSNQLSERKKKPKNETMQNDRKKNWKYQAMDAAKSNK